MKIANVWNGGRARLGKVFGDVVVDLSTAAPDLPQSLVEILKLGAPALDRLSAVGRTPDAELPLSSVRLLAPIPNPSKYLAIGMNYHDHAEEARRAGVPIPQTQVWFNKQVSCIAGPYDDVVLPSVSERMDYEAELGVVIGKRAMNVRAADAMSYVFGYINFIDGSARELPPPGNTFYQTKSRETFAPIGPYLVTADEISDPHKLQVKLWVNGTLKQDFTTADMANKIPRCIEWVSSIHHLDPGDIIATGTNHGGLNPFMDGDTIELETAGLGRLKFAVRDDLKRTWARDTRLERHRQKLPTITPQLTGKYAPAQK